MSQKLVAIESVGPIPSAEKTLYSFASQVAMYPDIPTNGGEIIAHIRDADMVFLSYTSRASRYILEYYPSMKYIGMYCSLHSPRNANVNVHYTNERDITATGVWDYGDEGVVEYVVSELVRCLHGFEQEPREQLPREITGLEVGIVRLGKSGNMIADILKLFSADISYYARSKKEVAATKGYRFLPLGRLLTEGEVICCRLNKNTILLHEEEFKQMGNQKILFNTGLPPVWDGAVSAEQLGGGSLCFYNTIGTLGGEQLLNHPHARYIQVSTGHTRQTFGYLSVGVLADLSEYNG